MANLNRGFTLLELIIIIVILGFLSLIGVTGFVALLKNSKLDTAVNEISEVINLARSKTIASQNYSQFGVYFDSASSPDSYTLFKGASYQDRDTAADRVHALPPEDEFSAINFPQNQVVFSRLTGAANNAGSVALHFKDNSGATKTIYVSASGMVSYEPAPDPEDTRLKDSRHTHIDYTRQIDTATENVVLTFNGSVVGQIPILENMRGQEFYWQGEVLVGGVSQTIEIHTHYLNNPYSQFSIYRDRSKNTASLSVRLSGDTTGNIINYSADGLTAGSTSIYAENLLWQ